MKVYVNRTKMDFTDTEDFEPTQTFELDAENLTGDNRIEFKFVKFQSVDAITIFIEENGGNDQTRLSSLHLFGQTISGFNMSAIKKVG
jgi:hypothetical protein